MAQKASFLSRQEKATQHQCCQNCATKIWHLTTWCTTNLTFDVWSASLKIINMFCINQYLISVILCSANRNWGSLKPISHTYFFFLAVSASCSWAKRNTSVKTTLWWHFNYHINQTDLWGLLFAWTTLYRSRCQWSGPESWRIWIAWCRSGDASPLCPQWCASCWRRHEWVHGKNGCLCPQCVSWKLWKDMQVFL